MNVGTTPIQKPTDSACNRACDACRQHKVRCLLPESISSPKICQRCVKTDRECLFTAPQRRKQRKRTDTRIAELEREVQAMRALFAEKKDHHQTVSEEARSRKSSSFVGKLSRLQTNREVLPFLDSPMAEEPQIEGHVPAYPAPDYQSMAYHQASVSSTPQLLDVVERGIICMEQAKALYDVYVTDLAPKYPAVIFSESYTVQELRESKSTLFLAVIAAAAGKVNPTLYSALHSEVILAYAHRTLVLSEKNIELVQAMLVTVVWYYPPGKFAQLKFYEYIHMAVSMAIEIGIGSTSENSRSRKVVQPNVNTTVIGSDAFDPGLSLEAKHQDIVERRTFLACYTISTGVSMNLRRPNMMRFSKRISDCIEDLKKSSDASMSDKCISSGAKIISIGEQISSSFSFDDPGSIVNLSEPQVQLMLNDYEKQLEAWQKEYDLDGRNDSLMLVYHQISIFLHEFSMYDDHPSEDFVPPYRLREVMSRGTTQANVTQYMNAITICISSAQACLDIFLRTDPETLRDFPIFNYIRMTYAVVVLIKLHASACTPSSIIGGAIDLESLKLDFYLDGLVDLLLQAVGSIEFRTAFTFAGALIRLRWWYIEHKNPTDPRSRLEPRSLSGERDDLALSSGSTDRLRNGLAPLDTGMEVIQLHEDMATTPNSGAEFFPDQYGAQMGPTSSSQFSASNMGIDDELMAIFHDIGRSLGGAYLNDWDPSMVIPTNMGDLQESETYDWNPY